MLPSYCMWLDGSNFIKVEKLAISWVLVYQQFSKSRYTTIDCFSWLRSKYSPLITCGSTGREIIIVMWSVFGGVRVARSLVFCVMYCTLLFVLFFFFFSVLSLLITHLVSSNFSFKHFDKSKLRREFLENYRSHHFSVYNFFT